MKALSGAISPGMIQGGARPNGPPSGNTAQLPPPNSGAASVSGPDGSINAAGASYFFEVTAINASGETTPSAEFSLTVNSSNAMILLNVAPVADATGYKFYLGTSAGAENILIGTCLGSSGNAYYWTTGAPTSASPPGANTAGLSAPSGFSCSAVEGNGSLAANTYYYKITATNASGETLPSSEVSGTISGASGINQLSWSAVTGATGYKIYRGTAAGAENLLIATIETGGATNFWDVGNTYTANSPPSSNTTALAAPVQTAPSTSASGGSIATGTYYYKVTATNSSGETTGSNEENIAVTGPTGEVTVNWNAVTGATGYKIYRGTSAGVENALVATISNGATTSFVDTTASEPVALASFNFQLGWSAQDGNTLAVATFLHLGTPVVVSVTDEAGNQFDQIGGYADSTDIAGVPAIRLSLWKIPPTADAIKLTTYAAVPIIYVIFDADSSSIVTAGGGSGFAGVAMDTPSLTSALTLFAFYGDPQTLPPPNSNVSPSYTPGAGFAPATNAVAVAPGESPTQRKFVMYLDQGSGANTPTFASAPAYWAAIGLQ